MAAAAQQSFCHPYCSSRSSKTNRHTGSTTSSGWLQRRGHCRATVCLWAPQGTTAHHSSTRLCLDLLVAAASTLAVLVSAEAAVVAGTAWGQAAVEVVCTPERCRQPVWLLARHGHHLQLGLARSATTLRHTRILGWAQQLLAPPLSPTAVVVDATAAATAAARGSRATAEGRGL